MKKAILAIAVVGMLLLVGLSTVSAGDTASSETRETIEFGLPIRDPQRDTGPFMRLFIRLFGIRIRAEGKGNYTGPLGDVKYEDISYAFINEEAVTITSLLFGFGSILLNRRHPMEGPHNGEVWSFIGTVSLDEDGTYHIVGRNGGDHYWTES